MMADTQLRERTKEVASWEMYHMVLSKARVIGGVDVIERIAEEHRWSAGEVTILRSKVRGWGFWRVESLKTSRTLQMMLF